MLQLLRYIVGRRPARRRARHRSGHQEEQPADGTKQSQRRPRGPLARGRETAEKPSLVQSSIRGAQRIPCARVGQVATMADYTRTITLTTDADTAFRWLSDVRNLPKYFSSMTSAEPTGDGEEVHVTAEVPDHGTEEGEAWFRTDTSARRIEWGSEDDEKDYHGWLAVAAGGGGGGAPRGAG